MRKRVEVVACAVTVSNSFEMMNLIVHKYITYEIKIYKLYFFNVSK